jgi:hypothetical protein
MKSKIQRVMDDFLVKFSEHFKMIFFSAAENHIMMSHKNQKKFGSYTQLKAHQRKIRKNVFWAFLLLMFLLIGIIIGPVLFPQITKTEIYIPNGKGDILIGNISENQATIIFKTLDAENEYKPLATKAFVEVYTDSAYEKLLERTDPDDYAITHMIPITGLLEGKKYYIRILAFDSSDSTNTKTVSNWSDKNEPISVFTGKEASAASITQNQNISVKTGNNISSASASSKYVSDKDTKQDDSLEISNVQNENYLQPGNKVQTIISWKTNVPATTILLYREGNSGEEKELNKSDQKETKHAAVLTTLKVGTAYYFKVKSRDEKGNEVVSDEYSLRTPRPKETSIQQIVDNFKTLLFKAKSN